VSWSSPGWAILSASWKLNVGCTRKYRRKAWFLNEILGMEMINIMVYWLPLQLHTQDVMRLAIIFTFLVIFSVIIINVETIPGHKCCAPINTHYSDT
jgi:hypothetical protein